MTNHKNITSQQVNAICKLYKKGESLTSIGKKFNCDHNSVSYWLKRRGVFSSKHNTTNIERHQGKIKSVIDSIKLRDKYDKIKQDLRWAMTNFQNRECWNDFYALRENKNVLSWF